MIAKVIAHAPTRAEALDRLADALERTVVIGPRSNAGFLAALARAPGFRKGAFDTGFIDAHLAELGAVPQPLDKAAVALGAREWLDREQAQLTAQEPSSPWDADDAFQLTGTRRLELPLIADGENVVAHAEYGSDGLNVTIDGQTPAGVAVAEPDSIYVLHRGRQTRVSLRDLTLDRAGDSNTGGLVRAPMHGKVLAVTVEKGERVHRGQRLAIIEAMKMEHALTAPVDGIVAEIAVAAGAQVDEGATVMRIEAVKD
jgi:3-methylcrotonyl-CoA carboxylase alpha subunit